MPFLSCKDEANGQTESRITLSTSLMSIFVIWAGKIVILNSLCYSFLTRTSLLSAYDLIKSGDFPNPYDDDLVEALLSQAKSLATAISPVFNTMTGLPVAQLNFSTQQLIEATTTVNGVTYNSTNTAQAGTLILEYYRLSDLTGDESFRQNAQKAEKYLINPSPAPAFPGLVGTELDTDTGKFITFDGGWEAGVDSFIEVCAIK